MKNKKFKKLKIALIADEITAPCLSYECCVAQVTPQNYRLVFRWWKPDFLLVESAWNGYKRKWRKQIVKNPAADENKLRQVVEYAQFCGIPTVFWNKEDGVHFEDFIDKALLFEHIFTTDVNMIAEYKRRIRHQPVTVNLLMFAVQPAIHNPYPVAERFKQFCFVGSYTKNRHPERLKYQNLLFAAAQDFGLIIYDRNSYIKSDNYRLPAHIKATVKKRISHAKTGKIFKKYQAYLNINTVMNSPTMFSRRLIETLACASPIVSSPALAIEHYFKDYVYTVNTLEEAQEAFFKLSKPYDPKLCEQLMAGSQYILSQHTYEQRLEQMLDVIK
ncbi:CgeB family protein [Legionella septentrionalis]|uniref:Glycosyltransferase family 1 protein n=1 Tax=Legionella septentrionalis TaxID=2498109 RepID=A0A433JLZ7_9GAMM|nr:glycosyltransferase [Legionella septentrionalis]RUQ91052.1 glycosyltransferase family 1 protein [Legionella septentrionalis]RUR02879.1 glycosyltransferase family 1 protein [Legionella septentrionalis]RUR11477.1 glycosyltransferase family 1 protein [Legionella septentrionalis]